MKKMISLGDKLPNALISDEEFKLLTDLTVDGIKFPDEESVEKAKNLLRSLTTRYDMAGRPEGCLLCGDTCKRVSSRYKLCPACYTTIRRKKKIRVTGKTRNKQDEKAIKCLCCGEEKKIVSYGLCRRCYLAYKKVEEEVGSPQEFIKNYHGIIEKINTDLIKPNEDIPFEDQIPNVPLRKI